MITLASRRPHLVTVRVKETRGGFYILPVMFVPFVAFGLAMMVIAGVMIAGRTVGRVYRQVALVGWVNWWIIKAAVMPLRNGR